MSQNCRMSAERYRLLYARFLKRQPSELLQYGEVKGACVLDLCSGPTARLAVAAMELGPRRVDAVDAQQVDAEVWKDRDLNDCLFFHETSVKEYLEGLAEGVRPYYDLVFCQQGINYWFNAYHVELLQKNIKTGGRLIFNTFWQEPSETPVIKKYCLDGTNYEEITWMDDDTVSHVQVVVGKYADFNRFQWLKPRHFDLLVEAFFDIERHREGATDILVCTKRP